MAKRFIIITALIALSGCGGGSEGGERVVQGTDTGGVAGAVIGSVTGTGVAVDNLPEFVELPRGARAITNVRMDDDGKAGGTLTLETQQKPAELVAFYRASMARHALKIGLQNESPGSVQLLGESADRAKTLMVTVIDDGEGRATLNLVHSRVKS